MLRPRLQVSSCVLDLLVISKHVNQTCSNRWVESWNLPSVTLKTSVAYTIACCYRKGGITPIWVEETPFSWRMYNTNLYIMTAVLWRRSRRPEVKGININASSSCFFGRLVTLTFNFLNYRVNISGLVTLTLENTHTNFDFSMPFCV